MKTVEGKRCPKRITKGLPCPKRPGDSPPLPPGPHCTGCDNGKDKKAGKSRSEFLGVDPLDPYHDDFPEDAFDYV